jgi:hypothetical protein
MRAKQSIQGYVITEFTDVHWEANGLLDMNRNPRVFHNDFAAINSDIILVPKVTHYSAKCGKKFNFAVAIGSGGAALAAECRFSVWLDQAEVASRPVGPMEPLCVTELEGFSILLPHASQNRMARFELRLTLGNQVLAHNHFEIALYAERNPENLPTISSRHVEAAEYARRLGYTVVPDGEGDVQISFNLRKKDISAMQGGARYVVLADRIAKKHGNLRTDLAKREQPFMPIVDEKDGSPANFDSLLPNIVLYARHGTLWRGDWIANISWLRREGAFAAIPGGPLLDLSFDRVVPFHVMTGFRPWEYAGAVHSGLVLGWVHKPAVMIGERKVGRGGLVASTFRLMRDAPGEDPVATALFDAQIATAMKMDLA